MVYKTSNVEEQLNAGIYAPLAGVAKPMLESINDLATPLEAGQGVNVASDGTVALATDNATHMVVGSNLGLVDGTFQVNLDGQDPKVIGAVPLNLALVVGKIKSGETITAGDEIAFNAGELVLATAETQKFVAELVEGDLVKFKFKA